jgi:hypothetical protein
MLKPGLPFIRRRLLYNALSCTLGVLDKCGLMKQPLETELLITAARRRARLNDFGDETFREPPRRLLDCCESEARLTAIGTLPLAEDILQLLINRLQIQRDHQNWPRVNKETIVAPFFLLGLPRTGTTLLHSLLAQDHETFSAPNDLGGDVSFATIIVWAEGSNSASEAKAGLLSSSGSGIPENPSSRL